MSQFLNDDEINTINAFSTIWNKSYDCYEWRKQYKVEEGKKDGNDPSEYLILSEDQMKTLNNWIDYVFESDDDYICPDNSYSLKHLFERDQTGFYIKNGQFKGAMIHYGFDPVNPREINNYYRVKLKKDLL